MAIAIHPSSRALALRRHGYACKHRLRHGGFCLKRTGFVGVIDDRGVIPLCTVHLRQTIAD